MVAGLQVGQRKADIGLKFLLHLDNKQPSGTDSTLLIMKISGNAVKVICDSNLYPV